MANIYKFPNATENSPIAKRKKVIAAVAQEIVTSEDDDNLEDAMGICNSIENHNGQFKKATSSASAIYALGNTIRNTLLEINKMREQNRERRHKELLQVLTKIGHDYNIATTNCDILQKEPRTKETSRIKKFTDHLEDEGQHITEEYTAEELSNDTLVETDELFNTFEDSTINCISTRVSDNNGLSEVSDTKQFVNNQKTHNTTSVLKAEVASTLKSFAPLQPTSTPPIIKPIPHANSIVPKKNESKEDLQMLRAQMLEMQRKKMEDRERKKRELLEM